MLKPISADSTIDVVWHMDPAVEPLSDEESSKYIQAAFGNPAAWREHLKVIEGKVPTRFEIGVIPPETLSRIEDESGGMGSASNLMAWACFAFGLRDIKDGGFVKTITAENGSTRDVVPKVKRNGEEYVDPDWLSKVFRGRVRGAALFVGRCTYYWNLVLGDDVKN